MALWLFLLSLALSCGDEAFSIGNVKTFKPGITDCYTADQETFTCKWTYGDYQNLSDPGLLKLRYQKKNDANWLDCPDYFSAGLYSCYFSKTYTVGWETYSLQLRHEDVFFETYYYTVDDTVRLKRPSITECRSPEQETVTCKWTYGEFYDLSSPGSLKLRYKRKKDSNWLDCPDYVSAGEHSCYFNKTYTSVWDMYSLLLLSDDVIFEMYWFSVDEIVIPDQPVDLNWTVLNISTTCLRMDLEIHWKHPPLLDVNTGWLRLEYEVQHKEVNSSNWTKMPLVNSPYTPLYALKIGREHLVRIRCKKVSAKTFGEFSEVLHIPALDHPEIEMVKADAPWFLFLIIGLCAVVLIFMFVIFYKKKRLKILILPPVPVPKIKGIDPDLLQKGKLDEVNFILSNHDSYKQELCIEDPWVEFIELDLDDPDEKTGSDTDRLLGEEHLKSHSCLGVKDDDSGRASCCEPDIPETDFSNSDTCDGTSDTGHPQNVKENEADLLCLNEKSNTGSPTSVDLPNTKELNGNPDDRMWPLLVNGNQMMNLPISTQAKGKTGLDFYALVSDITPAGRLLLSPGQRMKIENEECHGPAIQHPPNLNADNAYVCESAVSAFCAANLPLPRENEPIAQQDVRDESYFTTESLNVAAMNFCPAVKPASAPADSPSNYEMPVPEYTSVQLINYPQSLMLNNTALPDKDCPMPCGYMSADQVKKAMS
uniref:Growth hormone receptor n=1 Tax=Leptobrachium leishanense TaxID=445787 RepID=A0A8C5LZE0_9ANUR